MKKIGFVIPWYGENIPGGAEMELRQVTDRLHRAGVELEILTTCIKDAGSDWSRTVRRFRVGERNAAAFDAVNA